jgi:hypothetical protein
VKKGGIVIELLLPEKFLYKQVEWVCIWQRGWVRGLEKISLPKSGPLAVKHVNSGIWAVSGPPLPDLVSAALSPRLHIRSNCTCK